MSENSGMFQRFVKNYVKYLRAKTKKQVGNAYWEQYIALPKRARTGLPSNRRS